MYGFTRQIIKLTILCLTLFSLFGCQPAIPTTNGSANVGQGQGNSSVNTNVGQTNSAANTTVALNTEAIKAMQNNLIGTWVGSAGTGSKDEKIVFTADEITYFFEDKPLGTAKYNLIDESNLEMIYDGKTVKGKIKIEGDVLAFVVIDGSSRKYKRDSNITK